MIKKKNYYTYIHPNNKITWWKYDVEDYTLHAKATTNQKSEQKDQAFPFPFYFLARHKCNIRQKVNYPAFVLKRKPDLAVVELFVQYHPDNILLY